MCKRLIFVVAVVLLLCLPVRGSMSTWLWGDDEAVGARIGTKVTENNEAGLSMLWWPDEQEPEVLGFYGIHHSATSVEIRNPLMLEFAPETINGRPYIGAKMDIHLDNNKTSMGPVAGIMFEDILFLEYQYQSFSQGSVSPSSKIIFGLRIEF